jgi:hypothetical protein
MDKTVVTDGTDFAQVAGLYMTMVVSLLFSTNAGVQVASTSFEKLNMIERRLMTGTNFFEPHAVMRQLHQRFIEWDGALAGPTPAEKEEVMCRWFSEIYNQWRSGMSKCNLWTNRSQRVWASICDECFRRVQLELSPREVEQVWRDNFADFEHQFRQLAAQRPHVGFAQELELVRPRLVNATSHFSCENFFHANTAVAEVV